MEISNNFSVVVPPEVIKSFLFYSLSFGEGFLKGGSFVKIYFINIKIKCQVFFYKNKKWYFIFILQYWTLFDFKKACFFISYVQYNVVAFAF
jgi:hypothetical protein